MAYLDYTGLSYFWEKLKAYFVPQTLNTRDGSKVLITNSSKTVTESNVSSTELGYLSGVTSNIQTQLNGKASSSSIPTKVSDLSNDSNFITASGAPVQSVNGLEGTVVLNASEIPYSSDNDTTTIYNKIETLVTAGGEPNVLEKVKVNNSELTITNKAVNLTVVSGTNNGTIAVNGSDVSVKGLGTAAYTASTAYATSTQGTKADNAVPNTTTVNGHALSSNVTVTAGDVGLGNVTNESKATMFTNPAFTGTPTIGGVNVATVNDISSALTGAATYKGTAAQESIISATSYKTGWYWVVSTAGNFFGEACEVGDMIFANSDKSDSASSSDFDIIQSNIVAITNGQIDTIVAS